MMVCQIRPSCETEMVPPSAESALAVGEKAMGSQKNELPKTRRSMPNGIARVVGDSVVEGDDQRAAEAERHGLAGVEGRVERGHGSREAVLNAGVPRR
jgi:hypothetical protein